MKRGEVGGKRGSNNTANSSSSPGKKENNKTLAERERITKTSSEKNNPCRPSVGEENGWMFF